MTISGSILNRSRDQSTGPLQTVARHRLGEARKAERCRDRFVHRVRHGADRRRSGGRMSNDPVAVGVDPENRRILYPDDSDYMSSSRSCTSSAVCAACRFARASPGRSTSSGAASRAATLDACTSARSCSHPPAPRRWACQPTTRKESKSCAPSSDTSLAKTHR
jgi:hypothetical protein